MKKITDVIIAYSLEEIAKWSDKENTQVHIPALQRGLVWRPKQIELLWDSLFRGIPIGSFVICPYINAQKRADEIEASYHLLDGQQRANAIQLGYDSFDSLLHNPKGALLWLDLQPRMIPQQSTRNYLFRITTPAHPWGYDRSDNEGYLKAAEIRRGLNLHYNIDIKAKDSDENEAKSRYIRPTPQKIHPFDAEYPVPVSVLFNVFSANNQTLTPGKLAEVLCSYAHFPWAKNVLQAIKNNTINSLEKIEKGLKVASETSILALCAPNELMSISEQEKNNGERDDITNIEHLFQRLNRQGTPLNGEELIYSMIKAYWPEIVQGIDGLEQKLMPASKLVALAFRVVLTEEDWDKSHKIASVQTVSGIRKLATASEQQSLKGKIKEFINGSDDSSLRACCNRIDVYLGIKSKCNWGLPPFLRSGLAYESPDFYLLLLLLARKHLHITEESAQLLTGCITWCSWFGSKNKKCADHVAALYSLLKDDLSPDGICKAVASSYNYFNPILTKQEISQFIVLPNIQNVQGWTWWNLIQNSDESIHAQKQVIWDSCVSVLCDRRSLLLYAQRGFINERFSDYDPARKDLWEEHNRPWDYDHILPHYYTYNQKTKNEFMPFCKCWANNNGNFRAWPFEDNRSDQATRAGDKLNNTTMIASFISQEELPGYNQEREVIEKAESALKFAESCRSRLLRIYNERFDSLRIGILLEKYREGEDMHGLG